MRTTLSKQSHKHWMLQRDSAHPTLRMIYHTLHLPFSLTWDRLDRQGCQVFLWSMEVKQIKDSQEIFFWAALTYGKLATRTATGTQDSWAAHFSVTSWYTSSMLLWLHIRMLVEPSETEDKAREKTAEFEGGSVFRWSVVSGPHMESVQQLNDRLHPHPNHQKTSISHLPINQHPSHQHTHIHISVL